MCSVSRHRSQVKVGDVIATRFNVAAAADVDSLALRVALPIWRTTPGCTRLPGDGHVGPFRGPSRRTRKGPTWPSDRKSTRLNSSHLVISYAVFCLKKKTKTKTNRRDVIRLEERENRCLYNKEK